MNSSNEVCHAPTLDALPVAVSLVRAGSEQVTAFFYAQSGSDADRENVLSPEKSYFQLRQNSAKKQRAMYDFFLSKSSFF
jgi:hypothetical protein